jgi:type IV pilus assembly protein PilW
LVGLALASIVLAGIHSSYRAQVYALAAHNASFGLQDTARGTLDLVVREVRMAGFDPTGAALPVAPGPACPGVRQGLVEATPTAVHVQADLDGDGLLTGTGEDVRYALDVAAGEIQRTEAGTTVALATGVAPDALALRYFDTSDPPLELVPAPALTAAQRDCVGTVAIVVRTQATHPDPQVSTALASEAASQVAIRSRALINF